MKNLSKNKILPVVVSAFLMLGISSCWKNKEAGKVQLNFNLEWFGESVMMGDTVSYAESMPLRLEKFKTYIDDVTLIGSDGAKYRSGSIDLIEFMMDDVSITVSYDATVLKRGIEVDSISFGLGVPVAVNALDNAPSTFSNDHPLGTIGGAGMYWTWATGYIFTKFEGKLASAEDEAFIIPFAFHTGTDEYYRTVTLPLPSSTVIAAEDLKEFNIVLDLGKTIESSEDEIDLTDNAVTHTLNYPELAERYVNLLEYAWTLSE